MATTKRERRWSVPSKRAKGYAEERKAKVHMRGPKEGKELTDYEAGMRSGYHKPFYRFSDLFFRQLSVLVFSTKMLFDTFLFQLKQRPCFICLQQ